MFSTRLEHYSSLKDTMRLAQARAEEGEAEGLVIWADEVPGAFGRLGRKWYAEKGGLWITLLLRPKVIPSYLSLWNLMAASLVLEVSEKVVPRVPLGVKWPNDVVEEKSGKKLAGILTWGKGTEEKWEYVLWGIGWNVSNPLLGEVAEVGIRMQDLGFSGSVEELLFQFLSYLEDWYCRFQEGKISYEEIYKRVRERCVTLGKRVRILLGEGREKVGVARDLTQEGYLVLERGGEREVILAGDCVHLRESGEE